MSRALITTAAATAALLPPGASLVTPLDFAPLLTGDEVLDRCPDGHQGMNRIRVRALLTLSAAELVGLMASVSVLNARRMLYVCAQQVGYSTMREKGSRAWAGSTPEQRAGWTREQPQMVEGLARVRAALGVLGLPTFTPMGFIMDPDGLDVPEWNMADIVRGMFGAGAKMEPVL